jgi:hypothetical protein
VLAHRSCKLAPARPRIIIILPSRINLPAAPQRTDSVGALDTPPAKKRPSIGRIAVRGVHCSPVSVSPLSCGLPAVERAGFSAASPTRTTSLLHTSALPALLCASCSPRPFGEPLGQSSLPVFHCCHRVLPVRPCTSVFPCTRLSIACLVWSVQWG